MKIFIDFDGVIFNTKLFKKQLFKIFNDKSQYKKFKKLGIPYSPLTHLKFLSKKRRVNYKKILATLNKLIRDSKKYVFSDAKKFLNHFPKSDLYLLSYGDLSFQRQKIKAAGVSKYFRRIVITDKNKAEIIRKLSKKDKFKKGEKMIFIDDKRKHVNEIKAMKDKNIIIFPNLKKSLRWFNIKL